MFLVRRYSHLMSSRRTQYVFERENKLTGEVKEFKILVHAADYERNPSWYHAQLDNGTWRTVRMGIPLSVWRKKQRRQSGQERWKIDLRMVHYCAVLYGADIYGLDVKTLGHEGGRGGDYNLVTVGGKLVHQIRVKHWLTPERASQVLHHEIQHAVQATNVAKDTGFPFMAPSNIKMAWVDYVKSQRGGRKGQSENDPIEVDARRAEKRHEKFPLTIKL